MINKFNIKVEIGKKLWQSEAAGGALKGEPISLNKDFSYLLLSNFQGIWLLP